MSLYCPSCGTSTEPAGPCGRCGAPPLLGGRYRLVRLVARDEARGTATWEAERDGARFAIRRGPPTRNSRQDQALLQSTHPRLAPFVEVMEIDGARWRVQAWVDGPDLLDAVAVRRQPEDEVLKALEEICEALEHLHGLSPPLVHGDLKPANVRRTAGGALLVDQGEGGGRESAYVAPELRRDGGRPPSPRSDLYALGATGIAMLTGEDPARLIGPDGRPRWRGRASVRTETRRLIDALLDPSPGERPASARAVRERIRAILDGEWATVPVRPIRSPLVPSRQEAGWIAAGALAVVGMHVTVGSLLALAALAGERLDLATGWPQRIGMVWLATLPLSQVVYVGPAVGAAWLAHRPLGKGVALGAGISVALYLAGALATLM